MASGGQSRPTEPRNPRPPVSEEPADDARTRPFRWLRPLFSGTMARATSPSGSTPSNRGFPFPRARAREPYADRLDVGTLPRAPDPRTPSTRRPDPGRGVPLHISLLMALAFEDASVGAIQSCPFTRSRLGCTVRFAGDLLQRRPGSSASPRARSLLHPHSRAS